jgi:predicted nuclease with RNAse H fold
MKRWLGVDVGAERKGFDVALVDERELVQLHAGLTVQDVVQLADTHRPLLTAIDSPRSCAPPGHPSRADERAVSRAVCGIRWTPDRDQVHSSSDYYAWIRHGLELFSALAAGGHSTIEVFPTASWTRWCGPRGTQSRALWSTRGLRQLNLSGVPKSTNQDQRDAIAAAVTARAHTQGLTEAIGEIVVPAT